MINGSATKVSSVPNKDDEPTRAIRYGVTVIKIAIKVANKNIKKFCFWPSVFFTLFSITGAITYNPKHARKDKCSDEL